MELAILVTRCQAGDELAWESLVRRFQARIYGLAYHYVGETEDARDLAQDIFIKVYEHLHTCDPVERFVPWMMRIARNACIDRLRRKKARPPAQDVPADEAGDLAARDPGPDVLFERTRDQELVHRALQSLSEVNREIIILKEMQGLRLEEIATMLDLPLGTVKSRSSRARVELAKEVLALTEGRGLATSGSNGTAHGSDHGAGKPARD